MPNLKILNKAGDSAEIQFYDEISPWGINALEFNKQLKDIQAKEITLRISSPGGDVFDGLAIMNALRDHPARVTTIVDGIAASAASFIAVGASDYIHMQPQSQMMIHDAWGLCMGDAKEMEKTKVALDKTSDQLAEIYAARAGGEASDWRETMREEAWFTPDEALEAGLIDSILREKEKAPALAAASSTRMLNHAPPAPEERTPPLILQRLKEKKEMNFADKIAAKLGISDKADETTILAALDEVLAEQQDSSARDLDDLSDQLKTQLVEAEAALDKAKEAAETATARAEVAEKALADAKAPQETDLTVVVDKERFAELLAAEEYAEAARLAAEDAEAEAFAQKACDEGRIAKVSREKWAAKYRADREEAEKIINSIPPRTINRESQGHTQEPSEDAPRGITAADLGLR